MATLTAPITPLPSAETGDTVQTPDSVNEAIRTLQDLANIQLKLQKERSAIENLELIHNMLDGELLSEDELLIVKRSLKGLSKYAELHIAYKSALEAAQQARDLIDQIIGYSAASEPSSQKA